MLPIESLEARVRTELAAIEQAGLTRTLRIPSGIDLSSNDYLGLSSHPLICARMADAVRRDGCGSTASRLLRGEREAFANLERRFAEFKNAESSLYFSSGYLANLAVLSTLPQADDVVFSDERNHASLIDGMRLGKARRVIFPHNDVSVLERALHAEPCRGQRFVVTESLFSMDGDAAPLRDLAELCRIAEAALIVDEAHAVGIYGERGSGLIEATGVSNRVLLSINPAGKALGAAGAFVAGPAWAIDYLIQRARPFIFSTAPPPSLAAALDAALDVIASEPERRARLLARARYLRARLQLEGESQIIPFILGSNDLAIAAAAALQREGFDVRAIRPPTVPAGTARLRISVNADLSESTLDRFAAAVAAVLEEVAPCAAASL